MNQVAPDTATVSLEFDSGDVCGITISWGLPPGVRPPGLHVGMGPKGAVHIQGYRFEHFLEGKEPVQTKYAPQKELNAALVRDFMDAVTAGKEPTVRGEDGRLALQISLAALHSLRTGEGVAVADVGTRAAGNVAGAFHGGSGKADVS